MGAVRTITADTFPEQGVFLHRRVRVCFHYDTGRQVNGTIVRIDDEDPFMTIFRLDDGRYVLATECMYSLADTDTTSEETER